MKKAASDKARPTQSELNAADALDLAREHVSLASALLQRLGPDQARVAWMLEDALSFLDEAFEAPVMSMAEAEKLVSASAHNRKESSKKKREPLKR